MMANFAIPSSWKETAMGTMNISLPDPMKSWVEDQAKSGRYANSSDYVRDLIRRDKERAEREAFDRLKAELTRAFAASEESYRPLTAAEVIARNRG